MQKCKISTMLSSQENKKLSPEKLRVSKASHSKRKVVKAVEILTAVSLFVYMANPICHLSGQQCFRTRQSQEICSLAQLCSYLPAHSPEQVTLALCLPSPCPTVCPGWDCLRLFVAGRISPRHILYLVQ